MGRLAVELGRVGTGQPAHIPGQFDHHDVQPEAQPQARDLVLTGVSGGRDLALDPPPSEPARDHHAVEIVQPSLGQQALDLLGLDPLDLHVGGVVIATVLEGLDDRQVGVGEVDVLPDEADANGRGGGLDPGDERLPLREVRVVLGPVEAQQVAHVVVEPLLVEHERDLVQVAGVDCADDGLGRHVTEERDLALESLGDRTVAAADDGVGLDAAAAQLGDGVLGGLGLLLARGPDERDQRHVHVADVVAAHVLAELPDGLEEREDLDVADGASDLGDHDVDVVGDEAEDAILDLVGDVRDHLHGVAQVVAPPLLGQHRRVDGAGGRVRVAVQGLVDEALVVTEVEVGLTAVVGDEHLAVLIRAHRPRVDVNVGVHLL